MCIDIVEICFGIADGQRSSKLSAHDMIAVGYYRFTFYFEYFFVRWASTRSDKLPCHMIGLFCFAFYTPPHNSGEVLWFNIGCRESVLCHMSVCPSVFLFPDDNLSKHVVLLSVRIFISGR